MPSSAEVTIDGQPQGASPVELILSPGPHEVRIDAKRGSGSFSIEVGDQNRFCFGIAGKRVVDNCR